MQNPRLLSGRLVVYVLFLIISLAELARRIMERMN